MRKKMISLMMTVAMGTVMISGATVVKADSDEKETVKLAVWSSGAADNFQKGADEFNKRQDKINFVVEMQSGDYSQYLGAKVASNDLPDMFFLNPYAQVQQFAATDRIVDLSEEGFATKIYDSVKDAHRHRFPAVQHRGLQHSGQRLLLASSGRPQRGGHRPDRGGSDRGQWRDHH